jgi:hypothetical protein
MPSIDIIEDEMETDIMVKEPTVASTIKFPLSTHEALKILKDSDEIPEKSINDIVINVVEDWISTKVDLLVKEHGKTGDVINRFKK